MTIAPGLFQRAAEFDRDDMQFRRTTLAVDPDGRIALADLPERRTPSRADIASAPNRWTSLEPWSAGSDLRFASADGVPSLTLRCEPGDGHVDVIDPAQDEWGGLGGRYERIADA